MSDKDDGKMDKDLKDIDDMKDKYYKPELVKAPDLNIPSEDTNDSPLKELKDGDVIKVKLDNDVGVQRFSHDIYSGWASGVRELYNNEARACRTTMRNHKNTKPEIHITINPMERQLVIEGRDSQGISVEIFKNSLSVLGVSTNFDGKEIGQMGMGFASYTTLFEEMILETYSRDTNEKFSALADSGVEFKILPTPDIKTYGTRLTGTYTERVDVDKMINNIQEYSRFSSVPTHIELLEDTEDHSAGLTVCESYKDGQAYLEAMFNEHFDEGRKSLHTMKKISIDNDDYTFDAFLVTYDTGYNIYKWRMSDRLDVITLVGTPIKADIDYSLERSVSGYILNIKDERKYSPTADRDRMKEESMEAIEAEIKEKLYDEYKEYLLESVEDYKDKIKEGLGWFYDDNIWDNFKYVLNDETTDEIVSTINTRYTTAPNKYYTPLIDLLLKDDYKHRQIIGLKGLRKTMMEKLDGAFDNPIYIRLPKDEQVLESTMRVMRDLDIVIGEEYIREHKLRAKGRKKGEVANVSVRMYSKNAHYRWGGSGWGSEFKSNFLLEINENAHRFMMRVDKDSWNNVLNNNRYCPFILMRDKKKGYDNKIKTYYQHMKDVENTMFYIGKETKTLKDILDQGSSDLHINLLRLNEFTIDELDIKDSKKIFITPVKVPKSANDVRDSSGDSDSWDKESDSDYWARIVGLMTMHSGMNNWHFVDDHHGNHLRSAIGGQLGLDSFSVSADNQTEVSSMVLRLKRELKDDDVFDLARQVLQFNNNVDEKQVEILCHKIEEKLNDNSQ